MPYDEYVVKKAKEKGLFQEKVFDPNVLKLSEEEKEKIKREAIKTVQELEQKPEEIPQQRITPLEERHIEVKLGFIEKIWVFILSFFGITSLEEYKISKSIHIIEKQLAKIKPSIYNRNSKKLTSFFAYRIYNLYTQLGLIRRLIENTFNSPEWANPNQLRKTGVELFFEKLSMINSSVVDEKFSVQNIQRVLNEFGSLKLAWEGIEEAIKKHFETFTPENIKMANTLYTNFMYIKRLAEYDFSQLLKRFDPDFSLKTTPNFVDVTGEALVSYLMELESIFLEIDFSLNNLDLIKKLEDVEKYLLMSTTEAEIPDEELTDEEVINLLTNLKNVAYENSLTNLIRVLKREPAYTPVVLHTNFDLFKVYCDIFYRRMKYITEMTFKERKLKEIEGYINKVFSVIEWVGVYNPEVSANLEERGFGSFDYVYHIGTINTFLINHFRTSIKNFLSLVLLSGFFLDKFFQKTLSELTYDLEKFEEKFNDFYMDMQKDGNSAKKVMGYLERRDITVDIKKTIERLITSINTTARELFNEFYNIFIVLEDCIEKLKKDIELHPPKYLRNIRSIGGSRNPKILSTLISDYENLHSLKEVISFLKD
ncbi:MAG: DUF5312 family protein [Brevinematia bacterium]